MWLLKRESLGRDVLPLNPGSSRIEAVLIFNLNLWSLSYLDSSWYPCSISWSWRYEKEPFSITCIQSHIFSTENKRKQNISEIKRKMNVLVRVLESPSVFHWPLNLPAYLFWVIPSLCYLVKLSSSHFMIQSRLKPHPFCPGTAFACVNIPMFPAEQCTQNSTIQWHRTGRGVDIFIFPYSCLISL